MGRRTSPSGRWYFVVSVCSFGLLAWLPFVHDPLLARDLKIGRPDPPRTYDDGGLVDLNSAPAPVIAGVCAIDQATAADIAAARPPGGYLTVDDVFSATDIPVAAWDVVRDRAVVLPGPV